MNYLAHTYLSYSKEQAVGNLLADFERFKDKKDYPPEIEKGISLHHAIDAFTDSHEEFKKAKRLFQPLIGHYAGVFTDIAMDYFLATDPKIYSRHEWLLHCQEIYQALRENYQWLPERLQRALPSMIEDNWLSQYGTLLGMGSSMGHIQRRAKYLSSDIEVFKLFKSLIPELQIHYERFFPELKDYCENWNRSHP